MGLQRAWIGAAVVASAAGIAASQDEGPPPRAPAFDLRVVTVRPPRTFSRGYALKNGAKPAKVAGQVRATIEGTAVLFADVDGNGRFDDLGVDGWVPDRPAYRHLVPLEKRIVVGRFDVTLAFTEDGLPDRYDRTPIAQPDLKDLLGNETDAAERLALHALDRLNELRLQNGLPPCGIDAQFSRACTLHALYVRATGVLGHEQDPAHEKYTLEGRAAGRASVVTDESIPGAVDDFYRMFFHRIPIMDPRTRAYGIGCSGGIVVIDGIRRRGHREWDYPWLIPAPDSVGQPTQAADEMPRPHEDESSRNFGLPITASFATAGTITDVEAVLREAGPKGRTLPVLVSWPGNPAHPTRERNEQSICVIPHECLRGGVTYEVQLRWKQDGVAASRDWTFTTR